MAVPTYNHDLTDWILDSDTTAWIELTNMADATAPDEADTESALQGTNTTSQQTNISGTQLFSQCRILTSPVTLSSGQVFLVWHGHGVATALETYANGGLRLFVASAAANWKGWAVGGKDTPPFPYGKWVNNPIDPTLTAEYSNGTPPTGGTSIYGVGSGGRLGALAVAKGQPHVTDIIRYGRAEARIYGGSLADGYATFSGYATANDATSARWGLIQETTGGYLWKGLMTLGYSSAVNFVDSNKIIFIQDCRKVSSTFNKIEVRQATSVVTWTGISFICLSPTTNASKGAFECIDDADVNISNSSFTDMDTFIFKATSTIDTTTFRRCGQVTQGNAVFTGCVFEDTTATAALLSDNPEDISNCTFYSDGSSHAIQINTAGSYAFNGNNFYDYTESSSGNEAIYNSSGGEVNLNVTTAGVGTISIRNSVGSTTNVISTKTLTVTVKNENNVAIQGAQVYIQKSASETTEYGHPANPYTSHASNNARGDATLEITQTIEGDNPASGWLFVKDASTKLEQTYRYASKSGSIFTLKTEVTGTDEGGGTSTSIADTGIGALDIVEGDTIRDTATPYGWSVVLSVSTNSLTVTAKSDGGSWSGKGYSVHRLAVDYVAADTITVPLLNEETNASGIASESYNYGGEMDVDIRVRLSTGTIKYFPYKTTATITGNMSVTAVLTQDTIIS